MYFQFFLLFCLMFQYFTVYFSICLRRISSLSRKKQVFRFCFINVKLSLLLSEDGTALLRKQIFQNVDKRINTEVFFLLSPDGAALLRIHS